MRSNLRHGSKFCKFYIPLKLLYISSHIGQDSERLYKDFSISHCSSRPSMLSSLQVYLKGLWKPLLLLICPNQWTFGKKDILYITLLQQQQVKTTIDEELRKQIWQRTRSGLRREFILYFSNILIVFKKLVKRSFKSMKLWFFTTDS